ncbi:DUF6153 family protein [Nocardia asiatica]
MVDQHQRHRASGVVRVLGVLVLLFGIAAMHTGVLDTHPGSQQLQSEHSSLLTGAAGAHDAAAAATVNDDHIVGHYALHACVFVLSAAAFSVGLVLLYRFGTDSGEHLPKILLCRSQRERPPPWTAPSLAELSILRI